MNYLIPCLITALKPLIRLLGKTKKNGQNKKKTFFTAKIQPLHLKAPSNHVKKQSDKQNKQTKHKRNLS